ncbi:hypothetical protein [Nocardiopsis sp. NRRL B-16309]|uniref:hypothetical protein n=1 Tax=Nocardiopsis sp. NRRL B-16309 TaxID=1519494 RepID=UPI0006AD8ECC|nr:hypothetical protein [Nocardiopsis sp. NRRL B-16309]KOX10701.1 hypothetical protein ADL05_24545 [Nocardiopsis sp. NRRL B-16309]
MHTSTAPLAHQKNGRLAPRLTRFRDEHRLGDVVLFDDDGVVIAFAGGDEVPVNPRTQMRAEQAGALYQRLLSMTQAVPCALWRKGAGLRGEVAQLITLTYGAGGGPARPGAGWPVVVYPVVETIGLVADAPPRPDGSALELPDLGRHLVLLGEALRPLVETA